MKITKQEFIKNVENNPLLGKKAESKWDASYPSDIGEFLHLMFTTNQIHSTSDFRHTDCKLVLVDIDKLRISEYEAEKAKEKLIELVSSIDKNGFNEPILIDENMRVSNGHHRLVAMKILGYTNIVAYLPTENVYPEKGQIINLGEWMK